MVAPMTVSKENKFIKQLQVPQYKVSMRELSQVKGKSDT